MPLRRILLLLLVLSVYIIAICLSLMRELFILVLRVHLYLNSILVYGIWLSVPSASHVLVF